MSDDHIEEFIAYMEAHRNECEEHYFLARPQIDNLKNRSLFRAAFERGYGKGHERGTAVGKSDRNTNEETK